MFPQRYSARAGKSTAANQAKSNYPLGIVDRSTHASFDNGISTVGYVPFHQKFLRPVVESGVGIVADHVGVFPGQILVLGKSSIARLHLRGENLTGKSVTLNIYDNASTSDANLFSIDGANKFNANVSSVNSADGLWVTVTYTPDSVGIHSTRLVISGGGIKGSVGIGLKGEVFSSQMQPGYGAFAEGHFSEFQFHALGIRRHRPERTMLPHSAAHGPVGHSRHRHNIRRLHGQLDSRTARLSVASISVTDPVLTKITLDCGDRTSRRTDCTV